MPKNFILLRLFFWLLCSYENILINLTVRREEHETKIARQIELLNVPHKYFNFHGFSLLIVCYCASIVRAATSGENHFKHVVVTHDSNVCFYRRVGGMPRKPLPASYDESLVDSFVVNHFLHARIFTKTSPAQKKSQTRKKNVAVNIAL